MSKHRDVIRCPLDLFRELEYAAHAEKTMSRALSAIDEGDISIAEKELERACKECQVGRFRRSALVNLIIDWGSTGLKLQKMGHGTLGGDCIEVAKSLCGRLENGEFWNDGMK